MSRNIKLLLFAILFANFQIFKFSNCHAQVPQKFNYQGIARDTKGNPMAQQRMTLKLTILPALDATEGEYEEIQTVTTNEFGLYTLQIGNGASTSLSTFKDVKWETGNKYIKVAIDPRGGSDFVDAGTNQLLSVPYAIYADKAGVAKNSGSNTRATNNFIEKTNSSGVTNSTSQIYDDGSKIGIGTTTPTGKVQINQNATGFQEHLRMQNLSATGAGRFTMYNDTSTSYATFTKYGNSYAGGYTGLPSLYPLANLLAFGNNAKVLNDGTGRFLISTAGNVGISMLKGGTSKLKFHADFTSENVGIGGNAAPVSRVHLNNTDGTSMDLRLTNTTTGHTATDGMTITQSVANASLLNRENGFMALGTNNAEQVRITSAGNVGVGTTAPTTKLDVNGQVRIQGGNPGVDKVLKSDANGLASWQPVVGPQYAYINVNEEEVPSNGFMPFVLATDTVSWVGGKKLMILGFCEFKVPGTGYPTFPSIQCSNLSGRVEIWYNGMNLGGATFASNYGHSKHSFSLPVNIIIPFQTINGQHFSIVVYNNSFKAGVFINDPDVPQELEVSAEITAIEL